MMNDKEKALDKIKKNLLFVTSLLFILSLVLSFSYNLGFFLVLGGFDFLVYLSPQDYFYGTLPYFFFICVTALASTINSFVKNKSDIQKSKLEKNLEHLAILVIILLVLFIIFSTFLSSDYHPYPSTWHRIFTILAWIAGLLFLHKISLRLEEKCLPILGNFTFLISYYIIILILVFSFGFSSSILKLSSIQSSGNRYDIYLDSKKVEDISLLRVLENWVIVFNKKNNRIEIYNKQSVQKIFLTPATEEDVQKLFKAKK